ncbi:MAG: hypothetical protein AAF922_09325 [Pseudomonadota bacterium]
MCQRSMPNAGLVSAFAVVMGAFSIYDIAPKAEVCAASIMIAATSSRILAWVLEW